MAEQPTPHPVISQFNSIKFRFWSFVAMFLLVFVHGYNLDINYLQPWTLPGERLSVTTFTEYFLANGLFRFRIPMLFIISGYLFALHDYRLYGERVRKRLRTLFVPYLIWSALGLLFVWILEMYPYSRNIVSSTHLMQIDANRVLLHDYHWYEALGRWILLPVPYQLWFIRVLLIYNLAYPAIRWCVMHPVGKWVFFGVALILWLSTSGFVILEGEGILFFSLGVWMQKTQYNIDKPAAWLRPGLWGPVFVLSAVIKTWLAFQGQVFLGNAIFPVLAVLHKLTILSGLITAWYGCNAFVTWCMNRKWFVWMSSFAFMIYVVHAPLVLFATKLVFSSINHFPLYRMTTFILLPLLIITFAIGLGALLRKVVPGFYGILTGGRGF